MNRIAFIIPYFGKFNNYFPIFLKSCEYNKDLCDWLIYTNDNTIYEYPKNVKVNYISWDNFKDFVKSKFDFPVKLLKPYKLCDLKPSYGYIFENDLKKYSHWGYCDCDLVWGKISDYITDQMLDNYKKIFDLGHCTIFKNKYEVNRLFMQKLEGNICYKQVFSSPKNHSFDEEYNNSINNILNNLNIPIMTSTYAANIYTKSSNFKLTYLSSDKYYYETEKKKNAFFVWDNGKIKRYIKEYGTIAIKEYMYIHFQSRSMKIRIDINHIPNIFKMIPNSFDYLEKSEIDVVTFNRIKKKHFNLHYFILRTKNLIDKIKKKVGR